MKFEDVLKKATDWSMLLAKPPVKSFSPLFHVVSVEKDAKGVPTELIHLTCRWCGEHAQFHSKLSSPVNEVVERGMVHNQSAPREWRSYGFPFGEKDACDVAGLAGWRVRALPICPKCKTLVNFRCEWFECGAEVPQGMGATGMYEGKQAIFCCEECSTKFYVKRKKECQLNTPLSKVGAKKLQAWLAEESK